MFLIVSAKQSCKVHDRHLLRRLLEQPQVFPGILISVLVSYCSHSIRPSRKSTTLWSCFTRLSPAAAQALESVRLLQKESHQPTRAN